MKQQKIDSGDGMGPDAGPEMDGTLPASSAIACLGGSLRHTHWAIEYIDFSYLEGDFTETGCLLEMQSSHQVALIFVFKGSIRFEVPDANWEIACTDQTHQAVWMGAQKWTIGAHIRSLQAMIIRVAVDHFQAFARKCQGLWPQFCSQLNKDQPLALFPVATYLDIPLQTCLQQILHGHMPAAYRGLYCEAKVMELMALQADCWEQTQRAKPRHSKTEYDRERILFAKEYLLKHMAMPPTLAKLALVSGLNEFKLKNGFREMFGNSVFAYLAEARLVIAQRLLVEGSKTATEIAFELGYSSLQHFSSRYKERYGVTPRQLRK